MPTPRATHESLSGLLKKLATEGWDVAQAELDLARAEAVGASKLYALSAVICLACLVMAIATLVIFAQAVALVAEPYFNSLPKAYLITGLAMSALTAFLGWLGATLFTRKYQPVGTIFKWLTGQRTS